MFIAKMPSGAPEIYANCQGEGPSIGEPCVFVRFQMCSLCCRYCDTSYTWYYKKKGPKVKHIYSLPVEQSEYTLEMSVEEVALAIRKAAGKIRRVVFTGGEPLLQQKDMMYVIAELERDGEMWYVEIETNGTVKVDKNVVVDQINCSPKLASSGNTLANRNKPLVIADLLRLKQEEGIPVCFKFVVGSDTIKADLKEIREWEKENGVPRNMVYLMPEGITTEEVRKGTVNLIENCLKYGYKISTRLQVLLYNKKRAV